MQSNTVTLFFHASSLNNKISLICPPIKYFSLIMHVDFLWSFCNFNKPTQFCQVWLGSLPASWEKKRTLARIPHHSWISLLHLLKRNAMNLLTRFLLIHEIFKCSRIVLALLLPTPIPPASFFFIIFSTCEFLLASLSFASLVKTIVSETLNRNF